MHLYSVLVERCMYMYNGIMVQMIYINITQPAIACVCGQINCLQSNLPTEQTWSILLQGAVMSALS